VRQHLADQEHLVTATVDRLADQFFGGAARVHLGGVDQRHAEVESAPQ
jgi:hypothetical protein